MLANFLTNLRKQRCIGAAQALSQLGSTSGWRQSEGNLTKEFTFSNFKEASNFMDRFTDYCTKTGQSPQWSNVYNRVHVTLANSEFGEISTKELELARYLDMLHTVRVSNYLYINEHHSYDHIIEAGRIGVHAEYNNQDA